MLQDKDRIFTNIYGRFDKSLKGAMARGCWVEGSAAAVLLRQPRVSPALTRITIAPSQTIFGPLN